ncbi:glycosyltransferase [Methylomonas sp. YC3]
MALKVLHVLGELNPSGAETMLYSAAPLLNDFDMNAEILSTGSKVGPYADHLLKAGYSLHHISFKKSPVFFWKVFKLFNSKDYGVIHLHTERANFWLGIIALLSSKRVLRTIHNTFPFTGFLGWTRKWQRQLLERLGVTHIAISESVRDTEKKYYGLNIPIIQNWYNSLHFQQISPMQRMLARANLNLSADSFVLVTVGNCSIVKNHTSLIRALAEFKEVDWVYLHIGIEKDNSERDLATELGVANRVIFYGLQTDPLIYLQSADLFVMPSTYEGFGIAAIEAISVGLPALLTNVPGLIDFKLVFKGLYYCEPEADSIAKSLGNIFSQTCEKSRQLCLGNAMIAEERFGIRRGLESYFKQYTR